MLGFEGLQAPALCQNADSCALRLQHREGTLVLLLFSSPADRASSAAAAAAPLQCNRLGTVQLSSSPPDCALSALLRLRLRLPRLRLRFPVLASPSPKKAQGQRSTLQKHVPFIHPQLGTHNTLGKTGKQAGHRVPCAGVEAERTAERTVLLQLQRLSAGGCQALADSSAGVAASVLRQGDKQAQQAP